MREKNVRFEGSGGRKGVKAVLGRGKGEPEPF